MNSPEQFLREFDGRYVSSQPKSARRIKVTIAIVPGVYWIKIKSRFGRWLFNKIFYIELVDEITPNNTTNTLEDEVTG